MQYIYYKTNLQNPGFVGDQRGTGFCSFMGACPTPVNLINVNGTMTITDQKNKIELTIADNVVSVPILIDEDIRGRVPIIIEEKQAATSSNTSFGLFNSATTRTSQSSSSRIYTLSVGKLFKTSFVVRNREFNRVCSNSDVFCPGGGIGGPSGYSNVIEMNISFGIEGDMHLVNSLPTSLPTQ